jgi:hypothetical protein
MKTAPHGNDALALTAWAKVRMETTTGPVVPLLINSLGSAKYLAAPRTSPRRKVLDHALITATAAGLAGLPVGPGVGSSLILGTTAARLADPPCADPHADIDPATATTSATRHTRLIDMMITDAGLCANSFRRRVSGTRRLPQRRIRRACARVTETIFTARRVLPVAIRLGS